MHLVYVNLGTGCGLIRGVLINMRLLALLFTAILVASPSGAQQPASSSPLASNKDTSETKNRKEEESKLPVSVAKIREALETTPLLSLRTVDERPTFRVQILDRQKIDELLATLNFKTGPIPAGGVYMAEQDRIMFPPVDNPLRQPFAAFSQPELLTILIENLVGRYLGGKAINAISHAERAHAEAAARDEVRSAIAQYCSAQPNQGAGIQICDTAGR
jgi:ribosomal protein L12E/L44/L45/RPP1/RPP2